MKPDIQEITELIRQRTGLVLCAPQLEHLAERIQERLGTLRLHDGGAYAALLRSQTAVSQQEWRSLLTLLTVGESYFFRDQGQFRLLRQRLLPALLERCRATRTLRIWSAGCSTGEELHSLAILLWELLSSEAAAWDVELLGTDLNAQALERARSGRYGEWSFRQVAPQVRARYFQRHRTDWELLPEIRAMVHFQAGNLVQDAARLQARGGLGFDLILCRNVLIYFDPAMVPDIASGLGERLAPGGYLMTGHAEVLRPPHGLLIVLEEDGVVYQRPGGQGSKQVPAGPQVAATRPHRRGRRPPSGVEVAVSPPLPAKEGSRVNALEAARSAADRGAYEEARQLCEHLRAAEPMGVSPHRLLAELAMACGDIEEAKTQLKRVLYLAPRDVAAYDCLASLYADEGKVERAATLRQAALELLADYIPDAEVEGFPGGTAATLRARWEAEAGPQTAIVAGHTRGGR